MKVLLLSTMCLIVVLTGCVSPNPTREDKPSDADAIAAELTRKWERAESGEPEPGQSRCEKRDAPRQTKLMLLDEAEKLAMEHPRHVPTLMLCAALSYELDRPENALAFLDALFEAEPAHAEAAILRSRIALAQGNIAYAIRLLEEQAELAPDNFSLREARAAALFLAARYPEALVDLTTAEKLGAPTWRISFNRGLIAEQQSKFEDAMDCYILCLAERPGWEPAQERLRGLESGRQTWYQNMK